MDSPEPIIAPEDSRFLEREGLLSEATNNKRKISTVLTTPPTSDTSRSSSSSSGASTTSAISRVTFAGKEVESIEIPTHIESATTYEWLGFTAAKAAELYQWFTEVPDDDQLKDFYYVAEFQLTWSKVEDAYTESDDWRACMDGLGINQTLQDAILNPEYEEIRFTQSCKFWLLDTMGDKYSFLLDMPERIRDGTATMHSIRERAKRRKPAASFSQSSSLATPATPPQAGDDSGVSMPTSSATPSAPAVATTVETPLSLPGHTTLWRAGTLSGATSFYDIATQKIDLYAISMSPGDFCGPIRRTYWTPQKETAERYARFAMSRKDFEPAAILQVFVPDSFLATLKIAEVWFGDDWKKLIWASRKIKEFPPELQELESSDVLVGHVASGINNKFTKLKGPELIKERALLMVCIGGEWKRAVQWVFQSAKARQGFERECRGKVYIHRIGPIP
ncbi:MAG: hypothetical protein M1838_001948 [Thelocarpon superellum]|nr:MAG: hypothetical protein M1838_001948 [Thelocarpon superellum]